MTKTETAHVWLPDNRVAFEPTYEIVRREKRHLLIRIPATANSGESHTWGREDLFLKNQNSYPLGSVLERECPTCEGWKMRAWEDDEKKRAGLEPCPDCKSGTQKRRIVSVSLLTAQGILDDVWKPGDITRHERDFQEFVSDNAIKSDNYLIVAQTEAVHG